MKTVSRALCRLSVIAVLAVPSARVQAQDRVELLRERMSEQRPALLVLGSGHFSNPGRDIVNIKVDDVLSEVRQSQISVVVEQLASFHPTHIAVEWPQKDQSTLDAHYSDYRQNRYRLTDHEQDQLGLRLAARLNLPRVYAIDWNELPPGEQRYYNWYAYGEAIGQKALTSALVDPNRSLGVIQLGAQSIASWLLALNRRDALAANHRNYFDIARVGDEQQQPGANWVGYWYGRNLRIFNNLLRLTDRPQDRVLVIYGQGHAYLLRQFAAESGAFRVVDVDTVLK
jgi:hypothetical protein